MTHRHGGSPWFIPADRWGFILESKLCYGSNSVFFQIINAGVPPSALLTLRRGHSLWRPSQALWGVPVGREPEIGLPW